MNIPIPDEISDLYDLILDPRKVVGCDVSHLRMEANRQSYLSPESILVDIIRGDFELSLHCTFAIRRSTTAKSFFLFSIVVTLTTECMRLALLVARKTLGFHLHSDSNLLRELIPILENLGTSENVTKMANANVTKMGFDALIYVHVHLVKTTTNLKLELNW